MIAQDGYHDLSDQESSEEIHRMVDGRPRRAAPKSRTIARINLREVSLGVAKKHENVNFGWSWLKI